jgi:hypothetical protein
MRKHTKTFGMPHAKMTLQGFLSDINRPYVMQMLLDFSFPQSTFPPFECVTTKPHIYALTLFSDAWMMKWPLEGLKYRKWQIISQCNSLPTFGPNRYGESHIMQDSSHTSTMMPKVQ